MKTRFQLKTLAQEFSKHRLEEVNETQIIDFVEFVQDKEQRNVNPYDLLQECVDTFSCEDDLDRDLKDRIIRVLKNRENGI